MPENWSIAEITLDESLQKPLDYAIPPELQGRIQIGMRVEVPMQKKLKKGTVSLLKKTSEFSVRPIARLLETAALADPLWNLADWLSRYYCCSLQRALKCLTPPNVRKEMKAKTELRACLAITHAEGLKLAAAGGAQGAVVTALLNAQKPPTVSALIKELGLSRSPVETLIKKGVVRLEEVAQLSIDEADFFPTQPKKLNSEQTECLEAVSKDLEKGHFAAHLLHGVTGSGKTEVYLQAIQKTLDLNKSALLLVPEIALTSQTIERFRARFPLRLAILHHRRSLGERASAWEGLKSGEIKIAIGARSAIFSPAQNLGLIIIDEEHDSSYKQSEEAPTYHARDLAVMRAKFENAVILLGSATPSLESFANAKNGKYRLSTLSTRATNATLPKVRIIDMKRAMDKNGGFTHFSQELLEAIKDRTEKGEQTLLLLNRRGYHRLQICKECKTIVKCPHCDLSLTYHKETNELRCHLCDYTLPPQRQCASCGASATLEFKGFGTEHAERSLHAVFPSVRTLRMDRDTTRRKNSHEEIFQAFRSHKADVLIGTQMVAKGFHFPSVTLVGILNADASLQIPDFRASEAIFQLITQAAGRSGRADLPGEVILQTFMPEHPLLNLAAKQDYLAFYESESKERELFGFPPFCRLIKLIFSGPEAPEVEAAGEAFRSALLAATPETHCLPLVPSGHPKIKDKYYYQFIIKTLKTALLSRQIAILRMTHPLPRKVNILIDVDPISTFF